MAASPMAASASAALMRSQRSSARSVSRSARTAAAPRGTLGTRFGRQSSYSQRAGALPLAELATFVTCEPRRERGLHPRVHASRADPHVLATRTARGRSLARAPRSSQRFWQSARLPRSSRLRSLGEARALPHRRVAAASCAALLDDRRDDRVTTRESHTARTHRSQYSTRSTADREISLKGQPTVHVRPSRRVLRAKDGGHKRAQRSDVVGQMWTQKVTHRCEQRIR